MWREVVVTEPVRLLGVALQFLTRAPWAPSSFDEPDLRRSLGAFPLVGALVAATGIATRAGAGLLWSPIVATILAVVVMLALTGALHEDGLADTADGLGAARDASRRLEIMRDPRLGTFGVAAVVTVIGLRVALLAPLSVADFARALLAGHVVGQAGVLVAVRWAPVVSGSSAAPLAGGPGAVGAVVAAVTVLATLGGAIGVLGLAPLAAGLLGTLLTASLCRRALGGVNGDVLGAVNQMAHLAALGAAVAVVAPVR